MKKKRNHKITLIEILALILITSIILIIAIPEIISATHKRITSATFETTLEKHGFTVTTENTYTNSEWGYTQSADAISPDKKFHMKYYQFSTPSKAKAFYKDRIKIIKAKEEIKPEIEKGRERIGIESYKQTTDTTYHKVLRYGTTIIWLEDSKKENERLIEKIFEELQDQ